MTWDEKLTKIFKAYDIRGIYPDEFDEEVAEALGRALAAELKPQTMLVGRDVRRMGESMQAAVMRGLVQAGVDVLDLGVIPTDMLYFASGHLNLPGLSITASHNPAEWCGAKIVRAGAAAVSSDSGLLTIRERMKQRTANSEQRTGTRGKIVSKNVWPEYLDHILSFVDAKKIKPTKIVAHTHFGAASLVLKELVKRLPLELVTLDFELDGTFPKGQPDPLQSARRVETTELVKKSQVDFGVAWDADADRIFFWDGAGNFIEGYYIGTLLAQSLVEKAKARGEQKPPALHCARLGWLFDEVVTEAGGRALENRVGHTFIKERMRAERAVFAEEMSGHYYFRDNWFADNGMIPFLLIWEMTSQTGRSLGELVREYQKRMAISGEINFRVTDTKAAMAKIETIYGERPGGTIRRVDGATIEFPDWRLNLRSSNTEPLLRLNVEGRNQKVVDQHTQELQKLLGDMLA